MMFCIAETFIKVVISIFKTTYPSTVPILDWGFLLFPFFSGVASSKLKNRILIKITWNIEHFVKPPWIKKSDEKHQVNHDSNKWKNLLVLVYQTQKSEHTCNPIPAINRPKTLENINWIVAFTTCVLIVTS